MKRYDYHINEYGEKIRVPKDLKKLLNLQYLRLTNKTYSVGKHDLPELRCDTEVLPDFIALYNHPADYVERRVVRIFGLIKKYGMLPFMQERMAHVLKNRRRC